MRALLALATSVVALTLTQRSAAEDQPFIMEALPQHLAARVEIDASALLIDSPVLPDGFFIDPLRVWDVSEPIVVCFFGGSRQLRASIASVAMQWTRQGGHLPLDFGDPANPRSCSAKTFEHIRVGFDYPGYWSLVGTDSVQAAQQGEQSMNLAMFSINPPPEPEFSRVVLHEFGHAIGLQHEHQSHEAPCAAEFDWPKVYQRLAGSPNFWSQERVDHNMKPRGPAAGVSDGFDRASIMLYYFPKEFYKAGSQAQCYTPGNSTISQRDGEAVRRFYAVDAAQRSAVRSDGLGEVLKAIDAAPGGDLAKSFAKIRATEIQSAAQSQFRLEPSAMQFDRSFDATKFQNAIQMQQ